jgi:hypothetical protein
MKQSMVIYVVYKFERIAVPSAKHLHDDFMGISKTIELIF